MTGRNAEKFWQAIRRRTHHDEDRILTEIEALASARLFGTGPCPADEETVGLLLQKIQQMGLSEPVPGEADRWRNTALGDELDLDVLMVFLGVWNEWDALYVLTEHGFIDEQEVDRIIAMMDEGGDPKKILKPNVIDAYRRRHGTA